MEKNANCVSYSFLIIWLKLFEDEAVEDEADTHNDDEEITVRPEDRPEDFEPGGRTWSRLVRIRIRQKNQYCKVKKQKRACQK